MVIEKFCLQSFLQITNLFAYGTKFGIYRKNFFSDELKRSA